MAEAVRLPLRRPSGRNNARLLELAAFLGVIGIAGVLYLQVGDLPLLPMVALVGVTLAVFWMGLTTRYEISLAVLAAYLLLADGYLKLRFQGQLSLIGRDALLLSITLGAFVRWLMSHHELRLPPLTGWVVAWCLAVLVQLANPENGTLQHSILTLRPHIEFVPLFFFGFAVMRTEYRLKGFAWLLISCAAVNGIVGLLQTNLTPEELAGWGPGYADKVFGNADVSGRGFVDASGEVRTRPFALGSDQGFGGALGVLAAPASVALLTVTRRPVLRALAAALAGGTALAIVTSQARVALIAAVVALLIYLILGPPAGRRLKTLTAGLSAAAVTWLIVASLSGGTHTGVFDRYQSIAPGLVVDTAFDYRKDTLALVPEYVADFPLGAGLGTVGPGRSVPGGNGRLLNGESQFTFLLVEVGVAGLLVMFAFTVRLLSLVLRRLKDIDELDVRLMLAALAAPLFAKFLAWSGGPTTAGTPDSPYLWFLAGVLAWWLGGSRVAR